MLVVPVVIPPGCCSVYMAICFCPFQAKVGEGYPCHYSIAAIVCLFGAIQSTIMAVCVQRDMEQWRLGLNIRLYSSAYAVSETLFICQESSSISYSQSKEFNIYVTCFTQGLVASGLAFPLLSWCLRKKGPLFVSVFSPLMLIFVAVLSSLLLDEALYLGRWIHFKLTHCISTDVPLRISFV